MRKPVKGETLYLLNVGNKSRHVEQVLRPAVVESVGRKYFTVMPEGATYFDEQFHIDTWVQKTEYSVGWSLYETPEQRADELESYALFREIRDTFSGRIRLDLEQLREIMAIIKRT